VLCSRGLTASAVGDGSMSLTVAYGPGDEEVGVAAFRRAHDLGVTFFGVAEVLFTGIRVRTGLSVRATAAWSP